MKLRRRLGILDIPWASNKVSKSQIWKEEKKLVHDFTKYKGASDLVMRQPRQRFIADLITKVKSARNKHQWITTYATGEKVRNLRALFSRGLIPGASDAPLKVGVYRRRAIDADAVQNALCPSATIKRHRHFRLDYRTRRNDLCVGDFEKVRDRRGVTARVSNSQSHDSRVARCQNENRQVGRRPLNV